MKNKLIKNQYLYTITGVVVATSVLIFLGFSRISKTLESNHAMLITFRTFQQLNHNLNENMLRARSFLLENYDPLVANAEEVKQLCAAIESPGSSFMMSKNEGIIDATESYCLIVSDTVGLVENFKSKNSILRNSIQYLPTLISQFQNTPLEAHAERLLNDTLRYTANPTEDLETSIKEKITSGALAKARDGKYKGSIKNLFFHVKLIVQSTQERGAIETEILSAKVNTALNSFESIYHKWHDEKEKELGRYYFGLLFLCSSLVIGIYLAIRKLQTTLVELNEFNENLESKVESRTLELSQALSQVELKQQMLLQSTKMSALGEMAGGIAHEINTPLGAIMLNAEMLIGSATETGFDEMLPPLEAITKTVERISKIIVGLRRFSRDSSQDAKKATLISQIMEDTLTLCNEKIKASSVDLKLSYKSHNLYVPCIPEQISQVILNLLNNSVDAILNQPRDQRWIQINVGEDTTFIEISITDSGNGIPLAVRNKLMQPFFTTKEVGKGTGLGLSISKGIIDDHLGKFFYDEKSQNTKFVIQLPRTQEEKRTA